MPRGRKKKVNNSSAVNRIGRKPKRDQQEAIDLTSDAADTSTVVTPTPRVRKMRTRLTLSQPSPAHSPLSSQTPMPKPSRQSALSKGIQDESSDEALFVESSDSDKSEKADGEETADISGHQEIETAGVNRVDIETFEYTVTIKVLYDVQSVVYENTVMSQNAGPKKFTYISTWVTAITRAKQHAAGVLGEDPPCFFIGASATVKWHKAPKTGALVFALEANGYGASWEPVEAALESKHTNGKKELTVALEFRFARNKSGLPPAKPLSLNALKRQEKEDKMVKDAKAIAEFNEKTIEALDLKKQRLMDKWMCNKATCPNRTFWCWVRPRDSMHLKVDRPHFVAWNTAIEKGDRSATVEQPPQSIMPLLPVQEKKARGIRNIDQNPFGPSSSGATPNDLYMMTLIEDSREEKAERRRREEKNRENELSLLRYQQSHVGSTYGNGAIYTAPMIPHPYPYPVPGYAMSPYQVPPPPMNPGLETPNGVSTSRSRTYSTLPDADLVRPSSPVEGNNVDEYVQWHLQKRGMDAHAQEGFILAGRILKEGGYDLQTIQAKGKGPEWMQSLGIKEGIAIRLRRDITAFGKYQLQSSIETVLSAPKPRGLSILSSRAPSVLQDAQVSTDVQVHEGIDEYPMYQSDTTADYDSDDLDGPPVTATQFVASLITTLPSNQKREDDD
jgi:hypothetical protein